VVIPAARQLARLLVCHVFNQEDIATVMHVADSSAALRSQVAQIAQTSRTLNRRTKTAVALSFSH
jgi:hypothetical protein